MYFATVLWRLRAHLLELDILVNSVNSTARLFLLVFLAEFLEQLGFELVFFLFESGEKPVNYTLASDVFN